jgi:hypothetical protein
MENSQDLARVIQVNNAAEAAMIVNALTDAGIRAMATGEFTASFRAEAPGYVEVVVAKQDLGRALSVLRSLQAEAAEIDWSHVDVGEGEK